MSAVDKITDYDEVDRIKAQLEEERKRNALLEAQLKDAALPWGSYGSYGDSTAPVPPPVPPVFGYGGAPYPMDPSMAQYMGYYGFPPAMPPWYGHPAYGHQMYAGATGGKPTGKGGAKGNDRRNDDRQTQRQTKKPGKDGDDDDRDEKPESGPKISIEDPEIQKEAANLLEKLLSKEQETADKATEQWKENCFKDTKRSYVAQAVITKIASSMKADKVAIADKLLSLLHGKVQDCINSKNANHVLIKIIEVVVWQRRTFIATEILNARECGEWKNGPQWAAQASYGCRVLNSLVVYLSDEDQASMQVIQQVMDNVKELLSNAYGSFVIRKILEQAAPVHDNFKSQIANALMEKVKECVSERKGSYVVEEALKSLKPEDARRVAEKLVSRSSDPKHSNAELATSRYGRHVYSSMLKSENPEIKQLAYNGLKDSMDEIKNKKYGSPVWKELDRIRKGIDGKPEEEEVQKS